MQPYLFPYIGYWELIHSVDIFAIFDDVNFIKRGYINRNSILVNGAPHQFTLELKGASQNKLIKEITIGENRPRILKTILHAYKKAPYFDITFPMVEEILSHNEPGLARFIGNSIFRICRHLKIDTKIIYTSEIGAPETLKGADRIIGITKTLGGTVYINLPGGRNLYSKEKFESAGLQLGFLVPGEVAYTQFDEKFTPNLSILDLLMFNSPDELFKIIRGYDIEYC